MGSIAPSPINLRLGWPNPALLPVEQLKVASESALSQAKSFTKESLLEYGPDDGYLPLRIKIAEWLTAFYNPRCGISFERICISGGASQNLSCVLQTFTDPASTQYVWMVAPTYFCACRVFDDAGFAGRIRAVPEDDEGIDIQYLEEQLRSCEAQPRDSRALMKTPRSWNKCYRHIIYTVPTFANPSGKIMSLSRRESLLRLARKYDALIITDDVYDMLQWPSASLESGPGPGLLTSCQPRLVDVDAYLDGGPVDEFGHSVSQGSFSKIVGPGLRTGWAEATPKFAWGLSQCGATRSGGCGSQFAAAVLSHLVGTTLSDYIHKDLVPTYARRYYKMMAAIERYLIPLGVSAAPPNENRIAGGYYIWIQLPPYAKNRNISEIAAEEYSLLVHPGSLFLVEGDSLGVQEFFLNGLRLCLAWEHEDLLVEGIMRLARLLQELKP